MGVPDTLEGRARDFAEYIEDIEPPGPFATMLPRVLKMAPLVWAMGLMIVFAGLGVGVWQSDALGKALDPRSGPPPMTEHLETARTVGAWVGPLQLLGLGMMLFGISATVLGIATVLRSMGEELSHVFLETSQAQRSGEETPSPRAPQDTGASGGTGTAG